LFKSQTDLPTSETPTPQGWSVRPASLGSQYPTVGVWQRALPLLNGFTGFAGRFVYEQSGTGATAFQPGKLDKTEAAESCTYSPNLQRPFGKPTLVCRKTSKLKLKTVRRGV
jgi:hypothetical protein